MVAVALKARTKPNVTADVGTSEAWETPRPLAYSARRVPTPDAAANLPVRGVGEPTSNYRTFLGT